MRYPISEALDRYSILWLKRFFGCDVDAEFEAIENYLRDQLHEDWQLVRNSMQLGTCNALQWMLEGCISAFEDDECVAQSALEIRRSNLQRVAAKNALAQQLGGGFQDQRVRYPGGEILDHDNFETQLRHRLKRAVQGYTDGMEAHYYEHGDGATGGFEGLSHLVEKAQAESDPSGESLPNVGPDVVRGRISDNQQWRNLPQFGVDSPEGEADCIAPTAGDEDAEEE